MNRGLKHEILAGKPISAGGRTIFPFMETWRLSEPGTHWAFTYSRPASILARTADGQETVLPVPDLTRRVILLLVAASIGATLMMWIVTRSRR